MRARPPERHELDPIEVASRDEIAALQLAPARGRRCATPTSASPHYRETFDRAGVHPDEGRPARARRPREVPVHHQGRPAPALSVRHVRRAAPGGGRASTRPPAPPASPPWSATPDATSRSGRRSARAAIRASGGRAGDIVHVVYGYGLFTGGLGAHYGAERLGCTVVPMSGGMTERQVQLIDDFRPDVIMVTPSYMLAIADEFERQGLDPERRPRSGSGSSAPSPGPRRCAARSKRASPWTRSTSTASPR